MADALSLIASTYAAAEEEEAGASVTSPATVQAARATADALPGRARATADALPGRARATADALPGRRASDIVAAVIAASVPAPRGPLLACSLCQTELDSRYYSQKQLKKHAKRKCEGCLRQNSRWARPQKRAAIAPGNSMTLLQLPSVLLHGIFDMIYDYDPADGPSTTTQLIGERAAGLWVAELFSMTNHAACAAVRAWADDVLLMRKRFVRDEPSLGMARAILRQSAEAGQAGGDGSSRARHRRQERLCTADSMSGLDGLRVYDELIRVCTDAVQLRPGSSTALEKYVKVLLDDDHPHSCYAAGFEASRVTAESLAAATFLHIDRTRRLHPNQKRRHFYHVRLFSPLASTHDNQVEWALDWATEDSFPDQFDRFELRDCSGSLDWYREQEGNYDNEESLLDFVRDQETSFGFCLRLSFDPVIRQPDGSWLVIEEENAECLVASMPPAGCAVRMFGSEIREDECLFFTDMTAIKSLMSDSVRRPPRSTDQAKRKLRRAPFRGRVF